MTMWDCGGDDTFRFVFVKRSFYLFPLLLYLFPPFYRTRLRLADFTTSANQ